MIHICASSQNLRSKNGKDEVIAVMGLDHNPVLNPSPQINQVFDAILVHDAWKVTLTPDPNPLLTPKFSALNGC